MQDFTLVARAKTASGGIMTSLYVLNNRFYKKINTTLYIRVVKNMSNDDVIFAVREMSPLAKLELVLFTLLAPFIIVDMILTVSSSVYALSK